MKDYTVPVGIPLYTELKGVVVHENDEPFVCVAFDALRCGYDDVMSDMISQFPTGILLRTSVKERLEVATNELKKERPTWNIFLTYGYRSLDIQEKLYENTYTELRRKHENWSDAQFREAAHRLIAVPDVAGHPTGGAIDVVIVDEKGHRVDMGSDLYDFKGPYEMFNSSVYGRQLENRLLLRESMMRAGFMPFDGEYWHFCYGDREWAFLEGKHASLYSQKTLQEALVMLR